ncbi:MAG: carboxypeptidase-like regulatory domain-containing protein, partial [Clostridiales bacterium]|nr:carboxypeptidase-like regulatory domain-containing protein [Clostridiales bacterium]
MKEKKFLKFYLLISILLFGGLLISNEAKSQEEVKRDISLNKVKVSELVKKLSAEYPYSFFIADKEASEVIVTVAIKSATVEQTLTQAFTGKNLSFTKKGKSITISLKQAQSPVQKRFTGQVIDKNGEALPGVTITLVGSTRGVLTDENGNFAIDNIDDGAKLTASFIGMQSKEFTFEGKPNVIVVMEETTNELEEITVVAFGKQKKESVVASISTVKPSELKIPSSNLTNSFAGRVAGMISYQRSGEPGQDNAEFFIRGVMTFGYKVDPLILIDNVEVTTTDLARMQPDDIASFSIMKDATATALYGARGANGVILVTTKSGREGKAKMSIRLENSISQPTQNLEFTDPITYMQLHNEAAL